MKNILCSYLVFVILIANAQNRPQTMVLIPETFKLEPGQKVSSNGKSFCLEIENYAPEVYNVYSYKKLKKLKITIGNREPISLEQAEIQKILYLKNDTKPNYNKQELEFLYYFERGEKFINEEITISMDDKLINNIIYPEGEKIDLKIFSEILDTNKSSIDSNDFQGDLWFHQIKTSIFEQKKTKFELNSPRKIHTKNGDEFIDKIKKVLNDNKYCKPSDAELCLLKNNIPTFSFSFDCEGKEITITTNGQISVSKSIGNKYFSITDEKTIKLFDLFKKDIKLDETKESCSWDGICFKISKYFNSTEPKISGCPEINFILKNEISISDEEYGKSITFKFN
ncbi:hypothetical protein [Polaribacter porphyrae]|uniref:Gliding motility-associated protein GldM C-terminal domain-containing protein n=1 Tax=Polaribacter porphyrae TaxID=1137780 RepID=A0A2S7WTG1_9FLAO|nr:hypothetical protein [Polaribacter porphyrae]PQJ80601.1 hypothetical protein BTO18_16080 [Polaribacter porphyrae]